MSKLNFYTPYISSQYNYGDYSADRITVDLYGDSKEFKFTEQSYKFFQDYSYDMVDSSLLVPGLRFSSPGFVVFERPPTKKLVQYVDYNLDGLYELEEDGGEPEVHQYYIPIPWQVYIATYSLSSSSKYRVTSIRMYFSNTPLNHKDVTLYMPYIHNFFTNGALCNPRFEYADEIERYSQDLQGVISSAYDWVWNTGFNADLYECLAETVSQCSRDNPVVSDFKKNNSTFTNLANGFYTTLSNYEPHDVVNYTWANPSIYSHFNHDRHYYSQLVEEYISSHSISYDDDDFQSEEEAIEYMHAQTPYYDAMHNPSGESKTYSDIIKYIFDKNTNSDYLPVTSSPAINTVEALSSMIYNSSRLSS